MRRIANKVGDDWDADRDDRMRRHARRLIFVGYAPDAVRGMLRLQQNDMLWGYVQDYYDERKLHDGNSDSQNLAQHDH